MRGTPVVEPLAGTVLLRHVCGTNKKTYIQRYRLSVKDPVGNDIILQWKSNGVTHTFPSDVFSSKGTVQNVSDDAPFNDDAPADPTSEILIICMDEGGVGSRYAAAIRVSEVAYT